MNHLLPKTNRPPAASRTACGRMGRLALLLGALLLAWCARADISEPQTIFYGRIINRTSGQEDLITQGNLVWNITGPDGAFISVTNTLQPLNGGMYSYKLLVPHEALGYGLQVSSNSLPLPPTPVSYTNFQITVDGNTATILPPGSSQFSVAQALRAATYRLDLELTNRLPSTSGDGIPDWWKAMFGVVDPNADPDHDGWSNLQEFLNGGNPNQDNRIPTLGTSEIFVYADGFTGIRLQAIDSDSAPTNLFYTLTAPPQGGTLYLRNSNANGTNGDAALSAGAAFTQDDVNNGRLVFLQQDTNDPVLPTSFTVSLHDENPAHPATNGTISLNVYRPDYPAPFMQAAETMAAAPAVYAPLHGFQAGEQQMLINYFLGRDEGFVVWDASRATAPQQITVPSSGLTAAQYSQYVAAYGHDRRHLLMGGAGSDRLVGGMEGDIIIGGRGNDTLRGNGGADLFIIPATVASNETIEDFNLADNDVIDISRVLTGASGYITNYVQITNSGTNSYLAINSNGTGAGFTNLTITLLGTHFAQADLRSLVENNNLLTGGKVFAPQVSIVASIPGASENGPVSGQFTLTRTGPTDSAMTIPLQITGSAVNGSDYQYINPQATFAVGQPTVTLAVNPYLNSATVTQVVQVALMTGGGYELSAQALAQVTIEPLSPQISIQAIEPVAVQADQTPGLFLVTRGGVINSSVLVRLTISGTAPNGGHYASISSFVNLLPQQTTALLTVTPKTGVTIANGLEYVQIAIKTDPSYKVMTPSSDRVLLISQMLTGAAWQQQNFSGASEGWTIFAQEDSGHMGIRNLFRYAFGLNPQNPQSSKGLPAGQVVGGRLTVSFQQPVAVSDIDYIVEVSNDMQNWRSTAADVEQYFPATGTNDLQTVYWRSTSPVSGSPKQFIRVRLAPQ